MNRDTQTGIFGKLPAHGDFIQRNLATRFINEWDNWLQLFIGSSQERLGEAWLEVYLTSPIWRFCLSPGVVDDRPRAGILLPSVDRVGRYFPLTVMRDLPIHTVPTAFIVNQTTWFESIERGALRALDGQIQIDRLIEELNMVNPQEPLDYVVQSQPHVDAGLVVDLDFQSPSAIRAMPYMVDAFVASTFNSYSVWWTEGSERVEPCVFVTPGMPPAHGAAAMLDGLWEHWEWSVPVRPIDTPQQPEDAAIAEDDITDTQPTPNVDPLADKGHDFD